MVLFHHVAATMKLPFSALVIASPFPLSNAPLPTPAGWWRRPSSSPSSLARDDDDDGSDVHRCRCHRVIVVLVVMLVVVLLLSVVPSRRCVAVTIATAISIAAVAITATLTSLPPSPPSSTRLSPRRRIDDANSLNTAIAGCRHCRGHRRRRCRRHCIRCSHRCRHRCHHRRSKQPNFLARCKKYWGISKTTNPSTKLPFSKKNSK